MIKYLASQNKKYQDTLLLPITSPNADWFSKFFYHKTQL